ncbi:MFS transporter [Geomesophilobacter sediminis]|uniref:MFS transporter n=1 Tax=Geomesophilobacter sediminis TaxID=2798584 RepID=A0A8J7LYD5_9BACT|nr:MFS transporter [Geomesophilobacter sediminis]MBJ6724612.1 MFS transporter [Geomesophilobacter sediminis]
MSSKAALFTSYEKFVIAMLAILQFTVILDFMVLSPLGALLMPKLGISTSQFGLVVSAYAISAGASGLLSAGFADKFDRKRMLLFFYAGFVAGTLCCGLAQSYPFLLGARVLTGIFGGVIGSISFAIIADLFPMEVRGRVMGYVQMAFAASQVLGIPVGLYLATALNWHAPFLMIVGLAVPIGIFIALKLRPVTAHLETRLDKNPFLHLWHTATNSFYLRGFAATMLLATGGFMLMPFSSAFLVNNVGIPETRLSVIFFVTGLSAFFFGPYLGKLSDRLGKYRLFVFGSLLSMVMVFVYTHLGPNPIWVILAVNTVLWVGISSRMISSSALTSGVPLMKDRGAYMGINSSLQQVSGGVASFVAGLIVYQPTQTAPLQHFDTVGYVTMGTMMVTIFMMYFIDRQVAERLAVAPQRQ